MDRKIIMKLAAGTPVELTRVPDELTPFSLESTRDPVKPAWFADEPTQVP